MQEKTDTPQRLFIIAAPSGAGKSTLVAALMQHYNVFEFSISATTRAPRVHEQHAVHYYFLSLEDFTRLREENAFVEWEEVYPGKFYGTLRSEVDRILNKGRFPLFDVDVEGALHIKALYGIEAVSIFIAPPSLDTLRQRLIQRGTESMEEIDRRCEKARLELNYAERFDHIVYNDVLSSAIDQLTKIIATYI